MPLSVISLSTFLLYQIPFSRIMLYQIPFSCYTWFRYTWFRYTRFHFLVIPDSRIKFPCYTWFRYTRFCYTTFHILVMPDSVIPGSVIPLSYFPSYNWFRYTPFRYAQVRYTRFPIPLLSTGLRLRSRSVGCWGRIVQRTIHVPCRGRERVTSTTKRLGKGLIKRRPFSPSPHRGSFPFPPSAVALSAPSRSRGR